MAVVEGPLVPLRQVRGAILAARATQERYERLAHAVDQLLDIEESPSERAGQLIVEIDKILTEEQMAEAPE